MKSGPNYRMSSMTKTSLALGKYKNAEQKAAWKRAMVDAEVSAAVQPKRENRQSGPQGK
jgi:hypothetical protein